MKNRAFLGLGSNLGNREEYLSEAVKHISALPETELIQCSNIYETEPVGDTEQGDFLNAAVEIATGLVPEQLHHALKELEQQLGRRERRRWGPREIDIDILYYGSSIVRTDELNLPHPERSRRKFVLEPLSAIAPEFIDPETGMSVRQMLQRCEDRASVRNNHRNLFATSQE